MTKILRVGLVMAGVALGVVATASASAPDVGTATSDMTRMLAAIAHPDYAGFVAPATSQFKANVDPTKFAGQAKMIDSKIPLAQPYTVKFITTQKIGAYLNYIFEITLHDGDQVLASLTLEHGKAAGFHLL
ncbi:hypothetical protein [Acidiphilium sp.]|uniref:hypothetical protein n=1 Tax=Acidiphilium sp. TaxID=527 RepID=UPI003D047A3D